VYVWLEYAAFGRGLQRARESNLDALAGCRSIGVFGAGDGRCFPSLLAAAPEARFESIEFARPFIEAQRNQVDRLGAASRVVFVQADAREWRPTAREFDAVVTHFFLDCFPETELHAVIANISAGLIPGGTWLFGDFAIPDRAGFSRWRAKLVIRALCLFFRWQADHPLSTLPPMDRALRDAGFVCEREQTANFGLIRSALYRKASSTRSTPS
jgi:SAM-dependent methyltransferase